MTFLMASHGAYSNLSTQLRHPEQEILDWLAGEVNQQLFSWMQCIRLHICHRHKASHCTMVLSFLQGFLLSVYITHREGDVNWTPLKGWKSSQNKTRPTGYGYNYLITACVLNWVEFVTEKKKGRGRGGGGWDETMQSAFRQHSLLQSWVSKAGGWKCLI